jgi:hypothetical protein
MEVLGHWTETLDMRIAHVALAWVFGALGSWSGLVRKGRGHSWRVALAQGGIVALMVALLEAYVLHWTW